MVEPKKLDGLEELLEELSEELWEEQKTLEATNNRNR